MSSMEPRSRSGAPAVSRLTINPWGPVQAFDDALRRGKRVTDRVDRLTRPDPAAPGQLDVVERPALARDRREHLPRREANISVSTCRPYPSRPAAPRRRALTEALAESMLLPACVVARLRGPPLFGSVRHLRAN